ncbi:MAG TPA: hypothetical protein P5526_01360 [Anaerolineae bacterium]|nr:hypothetical protein [Anaerolineae bacterium]MCB0179518.1 hypothetical protein [Anaerolineae bacterium]MCB0222048.1 hypothetical protein [Anaerolineae bacterium]MCB9103066.1 hypothetical protein [Anaerolineales bacterium]HRV90789.1 hypothetical protein [Anaerolineae bacterium]
MNRFTIIGQRLVAIFLLGCLLFNYPLLSIFSTYDMLWGIPILYVYAFSSWLIIIILMIIVIEIRR